MDKALLPCMFQSFIVSSNVPPSVIFMPKYCIHYGYCICHPYSQIRSISFLPVSYTHLDVYKRQLIGGVL